MDLLVQMTFSASIFKRTRTKKQVFWQKVRNRIVQSSFKGQGKHAGYSSVRGIQLVYLCATTQHLS